MLLFVSPLALKKMILNIFMTNLTVVVNTQTQDSLMLKRDDRQPKLFRLEEKDAKPNKWKKPVRYLNGKSEYVESDGMAVMVPASKATATHRYGSCPVSPQKHRKPNQGK